MADPIYRYAFPKELSPRLREILHAAYGAFQELVPLAELRYRTRATHTEVDRLKDLRLLLLHERTQVLDGQLDSKTPKFRDQEYVRPTVLGLLHIPEADEDLQRLRKLVAFAARSYRPSAAPIGENALAEAVGASDDDLWRLMVLATDLWISGEKRPRGSSGPGQITLHPSESAFEADGSFEELLLRRFRDPFESKSRVAEDSGDELLPVSVRVTSVHTERFRALVDVSVKLGGVTVLVGPNASGKSSILDAIAFVGRALRFGLRSAIEDEGGIQRLRTRGAAGAVVIALGLEVERAGAPPVPAEYRLALGDLNGRVVVDSESLVLDDPAGQRVLLRSDRGRTEWDFGSGPPETTYGAPDELALAAVLERDTKTDVHSIARSLSRIILLDQDPLFDEGAGDLLGWHARPAPARRRSAVSGKALFGPIIAAPGREMELGRVLHELIPAVEGVRRLVEVDRPRLEIVEKGLEGTLRVEELSGGTRQMLLLAAIYLQPSPGAALLVEEPEGRVHPRGLQPLLDLLREIARKTPVVVTTHSPRLIACMDARERVLGLRRNGGVEVAPLVEMLRKEGWDSEFGSLADAFSRTGGERS